MKASASAACSLVMFGNNVMLFHDNDKIGHVSDDNDNDPDFTKNYEIIVLAA